MKKLQQLLEKFHKSIHWSGSEYWVFVNPDSKDIDDIIINNPKPLLGEKAVRFAFTKTGDMYAWHYSLLHETMEKLIGKKLLIRGEFEFSPDTFRMSPETAFYDVEQVPMKYVTIRLEKAFSGAKSMLHEFMSQLQALADMSKEYAGNVPGPFSNNERLLPVNGPNSPIGSSKLKEVLDEYDMWEIAPMDRRSLIDWLRDKGLLGPFTGSNHAYMKAPTGRKVVIPNDHGEVYSKGLLSQISRQANFALAGA